jgi:hypothetical protein
LAQTVEKLPDAAWLCVRSNRVLEVEDDALQRGGVWKRKGRLRRWSDRLLEDPLRAGGDTVAGASQPVDSLAPGSEEAGVVAVVQAAGEAEALDGHRPRAEATEGGGVANARRRRGVQEAAERGGGEGL